MAKTTARNTAMVRVSPGWRLNGSLVRSAIFPDKVASNVHPFPQSRHTGFADRDYKAGLTEREDGSYAL